MGTKQAAHGYIGMLSYDMSDALDGPTKTTKYEMALYALHRPARSHNINDHATDGGDDDTRRQYKFERLLIVVVSVYFTFNKSRWVVISSPSHKHLPTN